MIVPFVDLQRLYAPLLGEFSAVFERILNSGQFVQGAEVAAFETEFAEAVGARHAIAVSSGTSALHLVLAASDIGPGDEVIIPANTFIATAEAVTMTGARPVIVDVEPATMNIDAERVAEAVTARTRAIIAVHLYGRVANMAALQAVADRFHLALFEDACQAHGARQDGRWAGTIGDAGCFSFYPTKNLGTAGEGGIVVTGNGAIARRVASLRDHGQTDRYHHEEAGYNYRMAEIQAGLVRVALPHLAEWNDRRIGAAMAYRELLSDCSNTQPPAHARADEHVYHLFVVRTPQRDALRAHLERQRIASAIHYPVPIHLQPAYAAAGLRAGALPEVEAASEQILSLPMHPSITLAEIGAVAAAIAEFDDQHAEVSGSARESRRLSWR